MLISNLLSHQWKSFFRNERWRRNLFSRFIYGFLMLYFLIAAIVLGQNIEALLKDKGGIPFDTFNSIILFYFFGDLLIRCFLQPLPSLQMTPYLRFKIRHSSILTYLLYRSLWNIFNIIPLLVVIPFAFKIIQPTFGSSCSLIYLVGFFMMVLDTSFLIRKK